MYKLTPLTHPLVGDFLRSADTLRNLVRAHGSPLNIVFPDIVAENVRSFARVMQEAKVRGKVYVAHKPNKSKSCMRRLALEKDAHIDVASVEELRNALNAGFAGSRIEATGIKNKVFLTLALLHDVLISVDSFDEIHTIVELTKSLGRKARILVRLSGFSAEHTRVISKDSRFGISVKDASAIFEFASGNAETIDVQGFSYHLASDSNAERLIALENTIQVLLDAQQHGLRPSVISIGGGFPISLLADPKEWDAYTSALKQSVLGKHKSLSWNDSGLGFRNNGGVLAGAASYREHVVAPAGSANLAQFLAMPLPAFEGRPVQSVLADLMVELYVEPGMAAFDQAGVTLAEVLSVKKSAHGENVVVVDMNKYNLNASEIEHMVDPVVITERTEGESGSAYIAGNLCAASDVIYKHKTFFDRVPKQGDILAFVNTAPYLMDFTETKALQQPIAEKLAVWKEGSSLRWSTDAHYVAHIS